MTKGKQPKTKRTTARPHGDKEARPTLTRGAVLEAALVFADHNGVDSLSMRKLARELGFEVMSLYNHIANKKEILDGIVDLVTAEVELVATTGHWASDLAETARSTHRALVRHPWVCGLWYDTGAGEARLAHTEHLLATLRTAGFSVELAHQGLHAINRHVLGFSSEEVNVRLDPDEMSASVDAFVASVPEGRYPYLIEHARYHVHSPTDDGDFDFGLQLILDGLERIRDQHD